MGTAHSTFGKNIKILAVSLLCVGCTKDLSGQFLLAEQQQNLKASQLVNTKIDMLWVVDSSGSMESVQTKVRQGVTQFAQTYMKPTWDIRVASITTDTYLADPTFWAGPANQPSYLTAVRAGTANYSLPYLNGAAKSYSGVTVPARSKHYYDSTSWVTATQFPLFTSFDDPSAYAPPTVTYNSSGTEKFLAAGMRVIDTKPQLGPNWAKLLVGNHDGPQLSMCWDNDLASPQFLYGVTACYHRDDPANSQYHIGTANCANPATGETGPSQCVNTFANNSVHTGLPYLYTVPPQGVAGDQTWINGLVSNFEVQLTPSTMGDGTERAFQSVLQFLHDNESDSATAFFRPGSLRVIVFVGDEDDQSQLPDPNQYTFGAANGYGNGTKAHFIQENASAPFICKKNYTGANNGYFFPTADSGYCVDPNWLLPISTVKSGLDNFFLGLDGSPSSGSPNYFVATITTMNTPGLAQQGYGYIAQRYPALANAVGNGSMVMDITQTDYSPLLNQVGQVILSIKAVFQLEYPVASGEEAIVQITHADGTTTLLKPTQYSIVGTTLTITDLTVVQAFSQTDALSVEYQPSSSISGG